MGVPQGRSVRAAFFAAIVSWAAVGLISCGEGRSVSASEKVEQETAGELELSFPPVGSSPAANADRTVGGGRPTARPPASSRDTSPESESLPRRSADRSAQSKLESSIERAIASALARGKKESKGKLNPKGVQVSVVVRDVASAEVLVDRLGGTPLAPASNMKILTTASALLGLGADAMFETRFEAHGTVESGALNGNLVVRAGGDPLHRREGDGGIDPWLDALAADLRQAGISSVTGAMVLDEGTFALPGPGPEWPGKSQFWTAYCALSGGFSGNGGVFRATVTTDRGGATARTVLRPKHHGLTRKGSVSITGRKNALRVGANSAGVTVGGKVPKGSGPYVEEFSHPDPVQLFGAAVAGGLRDRGISIPQVLRQRVQETGPVVHEMRSPVASILDAILLDSNNAVADQLFLLMGHKLGNAATRDGAAAATLDVLRTNDIDVDGLVQVGGSGLSKANRVTARTFVDALNVVMAHPTCGPLFVAALPVSGESGSLRNRMKSNSAKGRVRAKTGWVMGASSLSGVVQSSEGEPVLTFSIIVSYPRVGGLNTSAWKPMQDEICESLIARVDAMAPVGAGR